MWAAHEDAAEPCRTTIPYMELTLIVCSCSWQHVCFPLTYLMFPEHSSIYLNYYTGLLSVSVPSFMHAPSPAAVRPAQALRQSRWVVQTNHCCSPMLWPATVPAALTPSSFFLCSLPVSCIPPISPPLFLHTSLDQDMAPSLFLELFSLAHFPPFDFIPLRISDCLLHFSTCSSSPWFLTISFLTRHLTSLPVCHWAVVGLVDGPRKAFPTWISHVVTLHYLQSEFPLCKTLGLHSKWFYMMFCCNKIEFHKQNAFVKPQNLSLIATVRSRWPAKFVELYAAAH